MGFLTGTVEVNFYNDSTDTEFPLVNVPNIRRTFKSSDALEVQTTVVSLAASGSQVISLNGLDTVNCLYLFSTAADILVNINALGNISMAFNRPAIMPASITSLTITNASATDATTVEILLAKES